MNAETNNQSNNNQLEVVEQIIVAIEEKADDSNFCKSNIKLSIKDDKLFIDEMILEGWTELGRNMVVEYYNISFSQMLEDLKSMVDNYDVSYETYIWLDNEGHGTNGAPYDMLECYKDSEEQLEHLEKLECSLSILAEVVRSDWDCDFYI